MGTSSRVSPSRTSGHGPAAPTRRTPEAELLELHSALAVLANAKELGLLAPYLRTCELHSTELLHAVLVLLVPLLRSCELGHRCAAV